MDLCLDKTAKNVCQNIRNRYKSPYQMASILGEENKKSGEELRPFTTSISEHLILNRFTSLV